MTINRSVVRKQLTSILADRLATIVERIFEYQASDFKGASPVVIVTNSGTQRGDQVTAVDSSMNLEIHTFVLYAIPPVRSDGDVTAGSPATVPLTDTSRYVLGQPVTIEDDAHTETAMVTAISTDLAIEVDVLIHSYTLPNVYIWTEAQSEDQIDDLEYAIADEIRLANEADIWLKIALGEGSDIDVVDMGGDAYRHETMYVTAIVEDF